MIQCLILDQVQDSDICNELGMEAEELLRLKHISGFSKLFENTDYKKSWETKEQIKLRIKNNAKEKSE